jgi:hypothetical protein
VRHRAPIGQGLGDNSFDPAFDIQSREPPFKILRSFSTEFALSGLLPDPIGFRNADARKPLD